MQKWFENSVKMYAEIFGISKYFANTHTHTHRNTQRDITNCKKMI
jgi:hypothetical protein